MAPSSFSPTPYAEVNTTLHELLEGMQAILGNQFVGMYLHGSLASGDFDPQRSDIDFVVVTDGALAKEVIAELERLHARRNDNGSKWAARLEGTYIPAGDLRRYRLDMGPFPCVNEGRFYLGNHEPHWVLARHTLREQGLVVAGPNPVTLIDPVSAGEVRQAVLDFLQGWWSPMLADATRLQDPEYQAYAVLTMCRALFTLAHGGLASKSASASWAREKLDERWSPLIEWALAQGPKAGTNRLEETLAFLRYALHRAQVDVPPHQTGE
jgi:hypothetical protein